MGTLRVEFRRFFSSSEKVCYCSRFRALCKLLKTHFSNLTSHNYVFPKNTFLLSNLWFTICITTIFFVQFQKISSTKQRWIVACRGVVQLGGLALGFTLLVPLSLRLVNLFYSLKVLLSWKERTLGYSWYAVAGKVLWQ